MRVCGGEGVTGRGLGWRGLGRGPGAVTSWLRMVAAPMTVPECPLLKMPMHHTPLRSSYMYCRGPKTRLGPPEKRNL